jgi:spermidine synthase
LTSPPPDHVAYVDVARASSPRGEVVLRERRDPDAATSVLELRVNGVFVMDTRETRSEQGLATAALALVEDPRAVVVAGLGLGFTAHEVLTDQRVERLVVVEIEEALVGWMRDGTVPHGPAFLADERVRVVTADIRQAMAEAPPASYDLVLLDVDNGPGFLVYEENAGLYQADFLRTVADVLRPGGAVVVWSAAEAPGLADELAAVFGAATPVPFEVQLQGREERYWLYLARR